MIENRLDFTLFYPQVVQAVAGEDYFVYAYMNDGSVRAFDVKPLIRQGGVFEPLKDKKVFKDTLTVIGNTVAWDLKGNRDSYSCIDIDPMSIFNSEAVFDKEWLLGCAGEAKSP